MFKTVIAIGNEIAKQQSEWDSLVETPKFEEKSSDGSLIDNYVLVVTFDLDKKSVSLSDRIIPFNGGTSPIKYRNINSELWGRRGDPWMVTCSFPKKLTILQKSIFGKPDEDIGQGLFQKSLLKSYPEAVETDFYKALSACYSMRNVIVDGEKRGFDIFDSDYIVDKLSLSRNHKIVMVSVAIKSDLIGFSEPTLLCKIDGFDKYVKKKFINKKGGKDTLCYMTGKKSRNVVLPSFSDREDLSKLFVTTTINYANNFDNKAFQKNYQIDLEVQKALQIGSNYFRGKLNNQRCSVRIANVDHYIIPVFLSTENIDIKYELDQLQSISEWVFATKQLDNTYESLSLESLNSLFWINYIAYASDGNSVKVINHIKDVSSDWFRNIVRKNNEVSGMILTYFTKRKHNLSSVYFSIPIRKDHEQKNDALKLLSQILEQRMVKREKIFDHFIELILCHYYDRYRSYSNVTFIPESFDFAIRDSVIKYLFLLKLLKSLNLINMEEIKKLPQETTDIADKLERFFADMGYTYQQQALYWLGRMVNKVGTVQYKKGHQQKPVLNKINYNGMDHSKIQRLYVDVFELSTQYKVINEIIYFSKMFSRSFPAQESLWTLSPSEGVFYILSGFSLYFDNEH